MFFESDRLFVFDFNDLDEELIFLSRTNPRLWTDRAWKPPRSNDYLFNFQEMSFAANAQIPSALMIARYTVMLNMCVFA